MASSAEVGTALGAEPIGPAPAPADLGLGARSPGSTPGATKAPARRAPWLLALVSIGVASVFAAPTGYLVWRSTDLESDLWSTVTSSTTLEPLARSLTLAVLVSVTAAAIGTGLAWLLTRTDVPGRRVWRILAPLPLVIPSFVGAAAFLAALAPGGLVEELLAPLGVVRMPRLSGLPGAWLVLSLFTYPYVYLPVAARLGALPPSLEESARLLGRRPTAVFRTVVLPQAASAVWAGALLVFLYAISDFGAVELMRYGTLTREIFSTRLDPATSVPLSLVLAVVALVVVAAERAAGRRRARTEAVRQKRPLQVPLGRWRWPATGAVVAVLGLALLAPVAVLAYWAGRGLANPGSGTVELRTDLGALGAPAFNTISVSLVAAVVAVVVVMPVAYLTTRHRSRVSGVSNAFVVAGFALPGLVVALALVFWTLSSGPLAGLYQTVPLLIFAYVVHFGAQAMRADQVAVGAVPRRLDDAARMLGAGRARRFVTVELPLMVPGLAAGAGLVLLSAMKELPATLLLAPPNFQTLATRLWSANESNHFAQMGLTGLVLVALSGLLTWLLVVRRADRLD
ncbi:ABC transporter permease [Rhabdothermincola sp.]|uniref:ABC transporter permease n=1 Tax=Rhabdothermincola sp. TaxID=2820405 RepID=UPI002FE26198